MSESKTEFVNTNPHNVHVDNPDFGGKDEQPTHVVLEPEEKIKAGGRVAELIEQVPGVVDVSSDVGKHFLSKKERDNRGVMRAASVPGPKAFPAADGGEVVELKSPRGKKPKADKKKSSSKSRKRSSKKSKAASDPRTVAQLRREAQRGGVEVKGKSGKKPTKADYLAALGSKTGTVTSDKVPSKT